MKYKILRIRQKISFLAFDENLTVTEFFARKIHQSYISLLQKGEILSKTSSDTVHEEFNKLMASDVSSCFKILMLHNVKVG
jgi:hypothetical protein